MKTKFNKSNYLLIILILTFLILSVKKTNGYETLIGLDEFDQYFHHYTKKYFGSDFDWRYFKAQAIAESRLCPQAQSDDGAMGLMQILPSTFDELVRKNSNIKGPISDPRWNIAAGIYYNSILWAEWAKERSFEDRLNFMFASYNAGKHTILKAQQIAVERGVNPYLWTSIAEILPEVNGNRSRETILYLERIHKLTGKMKNFKNTHLCGNTDSR
ncbi:MAG TPA: transglycosylase [Desulfobacteraceae bacterium]|nr:transglycosylase [Desulfobacteraceae bacterium]